MTCLGISNTGKLEIDYGKELADYYTDDDPSSGFIFRAASSTFWCRIRDLFASELEALFVECESNNAWSSTSLINQWDEQQQEFPEEIWRLDVQRKYIRTYQGASIDNSIAGTANQRFLVEMLNGRKKYQRRMFERNQELYFATKYFGNTATQDQIMMRFNNPVGATVKQDFTLYLTPYSNMYIGVKFGNFTPVNFRAKAGVEYTIPYDSDTADITLIYGASFIQAIGDLSKCYVGDNDFSKASRLQSLTVGSDVEGYENAFMTKINLGNNKLLEYLDIKNVTGLSSVVDLSQCGNLIELHAEGSGATGIIFANGGKVKKAYIPSVVSLTAKNLNYLEEFEVESYDNLQTLIVENTPFINAYDIVTAANALNTVRLIGMDWNEGYLIGDSSVLDRMLAMRGVGNDGYETSVSVLTGAFHASVVRQQQLKSYNETWKDLEVTYNTLIEQYPVTFLNYDGTVLDVQYVDKGSYAVDPIEREDDPIATPVKESTVSTDYTFSGWDTNFETIQIFSAKTVTALFEESVREYTIKYVSKGTTLQTTSGKYGSNVVYTGDTPTYTLEESGYKFYLFDRWDKSGFIDGDKTVNAIFDSFEYKSGVFNDKELSDLSAVEVYALTKMTEPIDKEMSDFGMAVETGDAFSFTMGYDIDYDDIESIELISENTVFDGTNYIDTGIKLFDEDKDFVLALDYKMLTGNDTGDTLMQCFQTSGSNGFKLSYSSGASLAWGSSSTTTASVDDREMLVIRHIKGDNNLYVYMSNMDSTSYGTKTIEKTTATQSDSATLVFGAAKMDSGRFVNQGSGEINWAKVWYRDLGDDVCKQLVGWTHEQITLEVDGFYRYALYDDPSKESMMSLLATQLLETPMRWGSSSNSGGWAKSTINSFLNSRFYDAIPYQVKALMKKVAVSSTIGDKSTELSESGCYVTIPALYDLDRSYTAYASEVYDTNGSIVYMSGGNDARKRAYPNGDYAQYWTRSPNMSYSYVWSIDAAGAPYGFNTVGNDYGILIEISF